MKISCYLNSNWLLPHPLQPLISCSALTSTAHPVCHHTQTVSGKHPPVPKADTPQQGLSRMYTEDTYMYTEDMYNMYNPMNENLNYCTEFTKMDIKGRVNQDMI